MMLKKSVIDAGRTSINGREFKKSTILPKISFLFDSDDDVVFFHKWYVDVTCRLNVLYRWLAKRSSQNSVICSSLEHAVI